MFSGVKRFVLWDYPRASWQYDVMVGIIVAFVFLLPREWFRDQPRIPQSSEIALLPASHGGNVYWIEPELLSAVPENRRGEKLGEILKKKTGKQPVITRIETIFNSEDEIKGYMAFSKP